MNIDISLYSISDGTISGFLSGYYLGRLKLTIARDNT